MSVEYVIRTQSDRAFTYGVGESIRPGITLFRDGCWGLTQDELDQKLKQLKARKVEKL